MKHSENSKEGFIKSSCLKSCTILWYYYYLNLPIERLNIFTVPESLNI
jgi:hypothetical protein